MQLDGKTIEHRAFGKGVITGVDGGVVTVSFRQGEKKFIYPDAFAGFLKLTDSRAQAQVTGMLETRRRQTEQRQLDAQARELRAQRLRELKITPNSQAAFGMLCNDRDEALATWRLSAGRYLSGESKGMPRTPTRLRPNSCCLVTERTEGEPESGRRITAAFMVREDFFGEICTDGVVESHETLRLALDGGETLRFWDYFAEGSEPPRWGGVEIKYFSSHTMQRILFDMKKAVSDDPERKETAAALYKYFCEINRLTDYEIGA